MHDEQHGEDLKRLIAEIVRI